MLGLLVAFLANLAHLDNSLRVDDSYLGDPWLGQLPDDSLALEEASLLELLRHDLHYEALVQPATPALAKIIQCEPR